MLNRYYKKDMIVINYIIPCIIILYRYSEHNIKTKWNGLIISSDFFFLLAQYIMTSCLFYILGPLWLNRQPYILYNLEFR